MMRLTLAVPAALGRRADLADGSHRPLGCGRGGKSIKTTGGRKGETELATLPAKRTERALKVDSLGKVLLADIGGTWAWMPLDGSVKTLTDLPCESGPATLSVDGAYVLCRSKAGSVVVNFKSGKVILQQPIMPDQVSKLLETGKTDLLDGFVSNKTRRKFKAFLSWDAKAGKVGFEFEPRAPRVPVKKAAAKKAA